jgi:hypothetical protein
VINDQHNCSESGLTTPAWVQVVVATGLILEDQVMPGPRLTLQERLPQLSCSCDDLGDRPHPSRTQPQPSARGARMTRSGRPVKPGSLKSRVASMIKTPVGVAHFGDVPPGCALL